MIEKNLKNVINGENFSLIGYGYQNSDKTHTQPRQFRQMSVDCSRSTWSDVESRVGRRCWFCC